MKILKKTVLIALACLLLFPAAAARADVIWEPDDDFYETHYRECVSVNRQFLANSPSGYVTAMREPGSSETVAAIPNGTPLTVSHTYALGREIWGVVTLYVKGDGLVDLFSAQSEADWQNTVSGWIEMSGMTVVYDFLSFTGEHGLEFYDYTGSYDMIFSGETIVFWTYPGSGAVAGEMEEIPEGFAFTACYRDAAGREWGLVPYLMWIRNAWVCISDPTSTTLPPDNTPPPAELYPAREPSARTGPNMPLIFATLLVLAVVAATGGVIGFFWRKKKGDKA
jgi:hypothetical protein